MNMGITTFVIGAVVGAGALFFFMKQAEAVEGPPIQGPTPEPPGDDSVDIFVDSNQITSERWEFEATYRNRTNSELRTQLIFELRDPQGGLVFSQGQDVTLGPDSTLQVFWDTLDISQFSNLEGNFTAEFRVEELFTGSQFARPFTVIVPISFVNPMIIPVMN